MNLVVCLVLEWVVNCLQAAWHISVVSCALVICLIFTPTPSGLGVHLQITCTHDAAIIYMHLHSGPFAHAYISDKSLLPMLQLLYNSTDSGMIYAMS